MASGTPLIASRAGALPEVTGDAALLVPPGDPEELSAALSGLLDDEPARLLLASSGLARVRERFAWPAVAAATEALYRKAINGEPGC
jgi:glycosyltransferase involved in cell wall biosynthesis